MSLLCLPLYLCLPLSLSLYFLSLSLSLLFLSCIFLSFLCLSLSLYLCLSVSLSLQLGMSHRGWGTGMGQGPKNANSRRAAPVPRTQCLSGESRSCTCRGKVARAKGPSLLLRLPPSGSSPARSLLSGASRLPGSPSFLAALRLLARSRARSALLLGRFSLLQGWAAGSARPGSLPGRRRRARGVALKGRGLVYPANERGVWEAGRSFESAGHRAPHPGPLLGGPASPMQTPRPLAGLRSPRRHSRALAGEAGPSRGFASTLWGKSVRFATHSCGLAHQLPPSPPPPRVA